MHPAASKSGALRSLQNQTIKTTKTPKPMTTLHTNFPPVSISEFPTFVGAGLKVGLVVADLDREEAPEPEAEVEGLAAGLDADPVPDAEGEDEEVSAVVVGVVVLEGVDFGGVVLELELGLKLELEPAATTTPPCALPAELDEEVSAAADL